MNENDVPEWVLKAAQETNAYVQQMTPMLKTAQEADDVVRPYLPLLRDVQKYMDEFRSVMATVGSALPPPELVQVMSAGMRELLWPSRQQRDVSVRGPVATVSAAAPAGQVVVSDAGTATDTLAVREDSPGEVAVPLDAKTVFLAILWVLTLALPPVVVLTLPVEVQSIIAGYVAAVGVALIVHWRVSDSRKR